MSNGYNEGGVETQSLNAKLWVSRYADYLYSFAIARLNDEELARDLVQETFLAGLEKLEAFQGKSSERTWLTAILKNKIVDAYRKKSSGLEVRRSEDEEAKAHEDFFEASNGHWRDDHRPVDFMTDHVDPLINKELSGILKTCMGKLPSLWLAVFSMKHVDDESTEVICSSLSVSASNYWVIMHRTKVNLRACLQKNWI
ncbi:sigma-70 family RNA polymerase sigma factor [Mucilaginibacter sp.]|jgi:RNA polymerase sigma-70 factor (ECF subfamily)|uniref:sigma-70 family RNA polymerase sigma factor n=1 Tax=Mucilaginibacter sp. TaxID=1882438 RepID=UPI0035663875